MRGGGGNDTKKPDRSISSARARPLAILPGRPVEVEDGYRCHQPSAASASASLSPLICFGLHLSFRLEIYSLDNAVLF